MPADPNRNPSLDTSILESILDQLACPACLGSLLLDETRLVCTGCGRSYPIVDGIPVLIAGREETAAG